MDATEKLRCHYEGHLNSPIIEDEVKLLLRIPSLDVRDTRRSRKISPLIILMLEVLGTYLLAHGRF